MQPIGNIPLSLKDQGVDASGVVKGGEAAKTWVLHVLPDYNGFLLAILPPGAFFGLGLLIAGKNWLDSRAAKHQAIPLAPSSSQA